MASSRKEFLSALGSDLAQNFLLSFWLSQGDGLNLHHYLLRYLSKQYSTKERSTLLTNKAIFLDTLINGIKIPTRHTLVGEFLRVQEVTRRWDEFTSLAANPGIQLSDRHGYLFLNIFFHLLSKEEFYQRRSISAGKGASETTPLRKIWRQNDLLRYGRFSPLLSRIKQLMEKRLVGVDDLKQNEQIPLPLEIADLLVKIFRIWQITEFQDSDKEK